MRITLALCFAFLVASCGGRECLSGSVETGRGCEVVNPVQCGANQVLLANVCTSTVPPTECGLGVTPIWVGERVICTDTSPTIPVTNCGQGQIKVPQSDGMYMCVIDPTQQPEPTTCAPGTQLVGHKCEPIVQTNAVVGCSLTNNSSQQWAHAVFTPTQEVMGNFACNSTGKGAIMEMVRFRPRLVDRRTGYAVFPDKIGQVLLFDSNHNIVATGNGVDSFGYTTLNFNTTVTIPVDGYVSWDLSVWFERAENEVRYVFEHQSSSATVKARNADDQRPADVRDSLIVWQGVPIVTVRAMPTVEFAALPLPSSERAVNANAGSAQIRNRSYWANMYIYRISVCVSSSVRIQDYPVRISVAGESPYQVNARACVAQSPNVGCCTDVSLWSMFGPNTTRTLSISVDTRLAPAGEHLVVTMPREYIGYTDGWGGYDYIPVSYVGPGYVQLAEFAFQN